MCATNLNQNKESKEKYRLPNFYSGDVECVADTPEELVKYVQEKRGELMGEAVYEIFYGLHLSTTSFWEKVFNKGVNNG
jgi:hypothetical protein